MEREDDIQFLEEFRTLIDQYLFLGYLPSDMSTDNDEMEAALKKPEFLKLRRAINEMRPRVHLLFDECNVSATLTFQNRYSRVGVVSVHILDALTRNPLPYHIQKHEFFDFIDQTIGYLRTNPSNSYISPLHTQNLSIKKDTIFIAMPMSKDDPSLVDVHTAIKEVAKEMGMVAERIDDSPSNEKITRRILEALENFEFVIADLTNLRPNVFFEAGYAEAKGKTPIYIAREGTKIEFDVQDYPIVPFKNITELKQELRTRLSWLRDQKRKI